ncbi:MAG TPA: FGGY-family carbohydrate kinase [Candidatus Hydrogenedentes bacterium]|mgnify:CR=1 FL=1|nr:FGGY-family carbohydrate kinase [Candidatus Hydrogenedentota bacterium]HPG65811.1 FGGY-family carbohydrate kinase [Candidatus Hydrogenedentota bacterium]
MASGILIGIDLGTTVLKVCAFDARTGVLRASAGRRLPVRLTPDGGREQSLRTVERVFAALMQAVRDELGRDWTQVRGMALAAQGGSTIIADRISGRSLTPMYLWNDSRAQAYVERLADSVPRRVWRRFVLRAAPPHGLARIQWLLEARPELLDERTIHVGAGEYLFFALTGIWRQDPGNAIQVGSYQAAEKRLDPALFNRIGVPLSFVAPLRQGHELASLSAPAAKRLGLVEGIPVAGPYIDQEAGYLSTVAGGGTPLHGSLGTAWVGNFALPAGVRGWSPTQLVLPNPAGDGTLIVQPLMAGNPAWDWALGRFIGRNARKSLAEAEALFAQCLLPPRGLVAVPWLTQPNPRDTSAYGAGAFFGVSVQTTGADLVRAVAAGLAFEFRRVFARVAEAGVIDRVVIGGGASKGVHFRSLFAALFAPLPVYRQVDDEWAAARGALFTLSPRAARGGVERMAAPRKAVREEALRVYTDYLEVFDRLYGDVAWGKAFEVDM